METRIKRLEIRANLKRILADTAEMKGRVASMATSPQLFLALIAVFVASGLLRWFGH